MTLHKSISDKLVKLRPEIENFLIEVEEGKHGPFLKDLIFYNCDDEYEMGSEDECGVYEEYLSEEQSEDEDVSLSHINSLSSKNQN